MAARSVPPSSRGGAQLVWMRFSAARECAPSPQTTRASTYGAELLLLSAGRTIGANKSQSTELFKLPPVKSPRVVDLHNLIHAGPRTVHGTRRLSRPVKCFPSRGRAGVCGECRPSR